MERINSGFTVLCLVAVAALLLNGCATSEPATREIPLSNQSAPQVFKQVIKGLLSGGYEIKSQDESSGIIQAFRPMTGAFARPGYGHKVTILIDEKNITITAFPMEGVVGGESPEEIRNEVIKLIGLK